MNQRAIYVPRWMARHSIRSWPVILLFLREDRQPVILVRNGPLGRRLFIKVDPGEFRRARSTPPRPMRGSGSMLSLRRAQQPRLDLFVDVAGLADRIEDKE